MIWHDGMKPGEALTEFLALNSQLVNDQTTGDTTLRQVLNNQIPGALYTVSWWARATIGSGVSCGLHLTADFQSIKYDTFTSSSPGWTSYSGTFRPGYANGGTVLNFEWTCTGGSGLILMDGVTSTTTEDACVPRGPVQPA
jgi:hypothetical protein